jgi:hypothetical protein
MVIAYTARSVHSQFDTTAGLMAWLLQGGLWHDSCTYLLAYGVARFLHLPTSLRYDINLTKRLARGMA